MMKTHYKIIISFLLIAFCTVLGAQDLIIKSVGTDSITADIVNQDLKVAKDDMFAVYAQQNDEAFSPSAYLGTLFVTAVNGTVVSLSVTWIGFEDYLEKGYALYSLGRKYARNINDSDNNKVAENPADNDQKPASDNDAFALFIMGGVDALVWENTFDYSSAMVVEAVVGARAVLNETFGFTALVSVSPAMEITTTANVLFLMGLNDSIKLAAGIGYGYYQFYNAFALTSSVTPFFTGSLIVVLPDAIALFGMKGFQIEGRFDYHLLGVDYITATQFRATINIPIIVNE